MGVLRTVGRLVTILVILLPLSLVVAAVMAFDTKLAIDRRAEITPASIARAKRILDANDPRSMRDGRVRTIAVTAADADVAVNYLMNRYADGSGQVTFDNGRAYLVVSFHPPQLPAALFVNLRVTLKEGEPFPTIERVRSGSLPIPVSVAESFLDSVLAQVTNAEDRKTFAGAVHKVSFSERGLALTYEQQSDLADTLRNALMSPDNQERLRIYNQRLVEVVAPTSGAEILLVNLLKPLFALAAERSNAADPVLENRAAILVLTAFVNGQSLVAVVPEARAWPRAKRLTVTLNRRHDSAQHFIVSAMLAANTGGPFADAVGLYKEISDSRGGSGFSFNDLGADRAGSRLGELAESTRAARRLQTRVAAARSEREIVPDVSDFPEGMQEAEFTRRFGGVGQPGYNKMFADIEARVAALPALQN